MDKYIDLRSDTVTQPTEGMWQAMHKPPLGDDVQREDPTVNRLEELAAEMLGFEASLFMTSGTMANQVGIKCHTTGGDEIICERLCHVYNNESAAIAAISGCQVRLIDTEKGWFTGADVREAYRTGENPHFGPSRLVCVEDTHNTAGGTVWPIEALKDVYETAHEMGLKVHMDGARLMNAAVAQGVKATEITQYVDSTTLCLSKGLGAPIGSVLAGNRELITQAVRFRKMLGGGWRQAGVIAAAGIYALENNAERLAEDHDNARKLAAGLVEMDGVDVVNPQPESNLVFLDISKPGWDAPKVAEAMKKEGVLLTARPPYRFRFVTHLDVTSEDVDYVLDKLNGVLNG